MKKTTFTCVMAVMALSACTQLGAEDRALISSAHQAAMEAKRESVQATEEASQASAEARRAREDSSRAAAAAVAASDKADKIFRQGQNK